MQKEGERIFYTLLAGVLLAIALVGVSDITGQVVNNNNRFQIQLLGPETAGRLIPVLYKSDISWYGGTPSITTNNASSTISDVSSDVQIT